MEKNQLNFDAPLISARRYSSPIRSSENVLKNRTEKPLSHRKDSQPQQKLQRSDWELSEVAEPGTVPFLWEKIPGKSKEEKKPESQTNTPRLPPRIKRTPLNISGNLLEMMKKGPIMDYENRSESGDDRYSDALDALSFSDSRSMSCSVSGLSDYFNNSDTNSHRKFSADIQTRDFMMNRFLPAAKAMILKTPQYSSKKQNLVVEKPKETVNTFVSGERKPRVKHDISHIVVPDYGKYKDETESENGIDEFEAIKKAPRKAFGLFAKFCLKNSLGLLNQVPRIKAKIGSTMNTPKRSPVKKNPAKEVGKMIRKAYSGPLTQIPDKNSVSSFPKRRSDSISRSQELYTVKTKPYYESPRQSHSGELRMTRGSSSYRSYTRGGLSPYRNEIPNSPIRKAPSFIGVTRSGEMMKVVKSPIIPKIEKTVYIDHVQSTNGVDIFGEEEKFETKKESITTANDEDNADVITIHPPLPKSPSESWLWRTLPSINKQFYSKNKQKKASNTGTKWETIVKISNVHHDHMRYSEELVPHLLQRRKT